MIARPNDLSGPGRAIRIGLCAVIAAGVALLVGREGVAGIAVAAGDPGRALALSPASPSALTAYAQNALTAKRVPAAVASATAALRSAPLDTRGVRTLGLALIAGGRPQDGDGVMRLAASLGWRDTPTQLWTIRDAIIRGDGVTAAQRADALARRRSSFEQGYATLRALAVTPGTMAFVAERLASGPAWRTEFLGDTMPLRPEDYDGFERLLTTLRTGTRGLPPQDVTPYVTMLAARGAYARARNVWLTQVADAGDPGALLADGQFGRIMTAPNSAPFGWVAPPTPEAQVDSDEMLVPGRSVLHVAAGGAANATLIGQLVVLPPGQYRFDVKIRGANQDKGVFAWGVTCYPSGRSLSFTPEPSEARDGDWRIQRHRFEVSGADCPAQVVALSARSIDQPGQYQLWFDDAEIRQRR